MNRLLSLLLCLLLLLGCVPALSACSDSAEPTIKTESTAKTEKADKNPADERYYILNTATKKYHLTNCSYLPSAENSKKVLRTATSTYKGYSPCLHCDP